MGQIQQAINQGISLAAAGAAISGVKEVQTQKRVADYGVKQVKAAKEQLKDPHISLEEIGNLVESQSRAGELYEEASRNVYNKTGKVKYLEWAEQMRSAVQGIRSRYDEEKANIAKIQAKTQQALELKQKLELEQRKREIIKKRENALNETVRLGKETVRVRDLPEHLRNQIIGGNNE